jgi:hypothetical protein
MLIRAWKSPLSYPIREESKFSSSNCSLTPNLFSLFEVLAIRFFEIFSLWLPIDYSINYNWYDRLSKMRHLIFLIFAFQPLFFILKFILIIIFLILQYPISQPISYFLSFKNFHQS